MELAYWTLWKYGERYVNSTKKTVSSVNFCFVSHFQSVRILVVSDNKIKPYLFRFLFYDTFNIFSNGMTTCESNSFKQTNNDIVVPLDFVFFSLYFYNEGVLILIYFTGYHFIVAFLFALVAVQQISSGNIFDKCSSI